MLSSEDSGSIQNPMKRAMGLPPASNSDMLKVVPSWPASEGGSKDDRTANEQPSRKDIGPL